MSVPTITQDERPILSAYDGSSADEFVVGRAGVTQILPYNENGEHCYIPWIAIYRGDAIAFRFPAHRLALGYEAPTQEATP